MSLSYHLKTEKFIKPQDLWGSSFSVINEREALFRVLLETDFYESRNQYNRTNKWDSAPSPLGIRRNNDLALGILASSADFSPASILLLSGFALLLLRRQTVDQ